MFSPIVLIIIAVLAILFTSLKVINEYERGVVWRLGRITPLREPGLNFIIPVIDKLVKVSMRTFALDVPPQDVITRDNVSVSVNAVIFFRVLDPIKAMNRAEDYLYNTTQAAQTKLRSILGEIELDELLSGREKINHKLQDVLDKQTDPWGIKIVEVEVKHVDLPQEMKRAMAKQAEAERERRAKIISAQGELQASDALAAAADKLSQHPVSIQLRFLQTLTEVAAEKNSTTIFPIPIELIKPFIEASNFLESKNKS